MKTNKETKIDLIRVIVIKHFPTISYFDKCIDDHVDIHKICFYFIG